MADSTPLHVSPVSASATSDAMPPSGLLQGPSNLLAVAQSVVSSPVNFSLPSFSVRLDRDNCDLWRTHLVAALEAFDLDQFLSADALPSSVTLGQGPNADPIPNPAFHILKKCDRFISLWIRLTMSDRALALIARCYSTHEIMSSLAKHFQAQTRARRMTLKRQLQSPSKGNLSMMEYIEKKTSLDASYGPFITSFTMQASSSTIDDLIGLLLHEEE